MADCTASGTAIDRVIQSAVASTAGGANNNASSAAASAATRAIGNFLGGTAATSKFGGDGAANMMGGGSQNLMPLAPMESIGRNVNNVGASNSMMMMQQQNQQPQSADIMIHQQQNRMDSAWGASSSTAAPIHHHHSLPQDIVSPMHDNQIMQQHPHQMNMMHHNQHPAQQMMGPPPQLMMQQQQQMMMMQQMQMQQHQMAAMVQYQKQQQQQQQQKMMKQSQKQSSATKGSSQKHSNTSTTQEASSAFVQQQQQEDDVATVSEEEQLHHEGITEDASIERLAQAWRDAEEEYANEFDNDDEYYDVSDMGGMYNNAEYATATSTTADVNATNTTTAEPQYEFSEASRTYGCTTTITSDIPPQNLSYPDNLYEQGLQLFNEGNISQAILCFESTLRNIDQEHADAWRMLGKCHTENDEDSKAIVCWLRSLERDPFSPETLLALGVAYVNELDHERAVETLRGWVANHPLYAGMIDDTTNVAKGEVEDLYGDATVEEGINGNNNNNRQPMRAQTVVEMRDVERLLLRALDYDRTADSAAEVWEALGVVYNVSRDYDAAVDAFQRAIDVRPNDYQLRNKLGATLANGNRSDEALPSYRVALRLKPKYARGWLNMAIAHSNLHNYSEAARCYLQTLSLNPEARHVWSYLRIALTCDEKWDLLPLAASQNLSAFHEHFDFVEY